MSRQRLALVVISLLGHVGLLMLTGTIPVPEAVENVMITMRVVEAPAPEPPPELPPPPAPIEAPEPAQAPLPEPPRPRLKPQPAPKPALAARTPKPGDAPKGDAPPGLIADFGVTLTGGGFGGVAVAVGRPDGAVGGAGGAGGAPARRSGALEARQDAEATPRGCAGPNREPGRPRGLKRPLYPPAALAAKLAGRVRVELTLDAAGRVTHARPLDTPGFGLEEAAAASLREARFEPALRCGAPVPSKTLIAVRFELQ